MTTTCKEIKESVTAKVDKTSLDTLKTELELSMSKKTDKELVTSQFEAIQNSLDDIKTTLKVIEPNVSETSKNVAFILGKLEGRAEMLKELTLNK